MKSAKTNQEFREIIKDTEVQAELLKELIEKVDPNFVLQSAGSGVGHAKA